MNAPGAVHTNRSYACTYLSSSLSSLSLSGTAFSTFAVRKCSSSVTLTIVSKLSVSTKSALVCSLVSLFIGKSASAGVIANVSTA